MIKWAKGGDANIVSIDFDRVALDSSLSSPPGSVVEGTLVTDGGMIRIKVRGCKKTEGERFRIEGRVLDASRDLRERLAALLK